MSTSNSSIDVKVQPIIASWENEMYKFLEHSLDLEEMRHRKVVAIEWVLVPKGKDHKPRTGICSEAGASSHLLHSLSINPLYNETMESLT